MQNAEKPKPRRVEPPPSAEPITGERRIRFGTEFMSSYSGGPALIIGIDKADKSVGACHITTLPYGKKVLNPPGTEPFEAIGELGKVWTFGEVITGLKELFGKVADETKAELRRRSRRRPVTIGPHDPNITFPNP